MSGIADIGEIFRMFGRLCLMSSHFTRQNVPSLTRSRVSFLQDCDTTGYSSIISKLM